MRSEKLTTWQDARDITAALQSGRRIQNRTAQNVPGEIACALINRRGEYTDMISVFHCIELSRDHYIGVAGDGENGSYEHFSFKREGERYRLDSSDVGYGDTAIALKEILVKEVQ